tara:strand:+ start:2716 stop:3321 length:606 start_codon:yes stop_codon:yes gene_type:complete
MKDKLLNALANNQEKLIRIMKTCPPTESLEDTLQDFYMYVYEKDYRAFCMEEMFSKGDLNEGLLYVCMKNFILNKIKKDARVASKMDDAYVEYYNLNYDENDRDSIESKVAYDENMNKLSELTANISKEDYDDILKLTSGKLLGVFRGEDDVVDMKAYQARRYSLSKIVDELKENAKEHKYLTSDDIDVFTDYNDFNNLNK